MVESLAGNVKREWMNPHAYYCLPLTVGNQYGFIIKSVRDFDIIWDGSHKDAEITFLNEDNSHKQIIKTGFGDGIITVQNLFSLKTPPGINIMTIQPPNYFIPGCFALTGVVECDNIRRDFTFNSMAMRCNNFKLIDPFNGIEDLKNGIIRCVGFPKQRFHEDPLRILRAIRFLSRYGYVLEKKTEEKLKHCVPDLLKISKERWMDEIDKILLGEHVIDALDSMFEYKIWNYFSKDKSCKL
jgi:hypothetical protein